MTEWVKVWPDKTTDTWLTYSGEFNSYAEALQSLKGK